MRIPANLSVRTTVKLHREMQATREERRAPPPTVEFATPSIQEERAESIRDAGWGTGSDGFIS